MDKRGKVQHSRIRLEYVGQIYTSVEWVGTKVKVFGGVVKSFSMLINISE